MVDIVLLIYTFALIVGRPRLARNVNPELWTSNIRNDTFLAISEGCCALLITTR
jgi:hypothetical protein